MADVLPLRLASGETEQFQPGDTVPVANGGTGVSTSTGSGSTVLNTSPTLVTPILGTPSSGVLSNCTTATQSANDNSNKLADTAYVDAITRYDLVWGNVSGQSPANATTYYGGSQGGSVSPGSNWNTTTTNGAQYIPYSGTIIACILSAINNTRNAIGGATFTMNFNNITSTVVSPLISGIDLTAGAAAKYIATNLNIPVTANDVYNFKYTSPTWSTTPQGVAFYITLIIK